MSYQIGCSECGQIIEALIPIISKNTDTELVCDCGRVLLKIYGPEHLFTAYVKAKLKDDTTIEKLNNSSDKHDD